MYAHPTRDTTVHHLVLGVPFELVFPLLFSLTIHFCSHACMFMVVPGSIVFAPSVVSCRVLPDYASSVHDQCAGIGR